MGRFLAVAALCALALSAAPASAEDVVVLRNGREARGRIVEETDAGVRLDLGFGTMFYPRASIAEVRRGEAEAKAEAPAPPTAAPDSREEFWLLYDEGRRAGSRVLRVAKVPEGFRFEEDVLLLDESGAPKAEVRSSERCDAEYRPLTFQVRESPRGGKARMTTGEVRGGRFHVTVTEEGDRTRVEEALPPDARFELGAREEFLRRGDELGGRLAVRVYDVAARVWRETEYADGGRRPIDRDGRALSVRVATRRRGDVVEREWIGDGLAAEMCELRGETLRAIATTPEAAARVARGDADRVTGPESAPRTTYADPEGGWRIGKPDPAWTFEAPRNRAGGALLTVRNAAVFATVDVQRDPRPPEGLTPERAAEALRRLCAAVAPDFTVLRDGWTGDGAARTYWLEARATTKGEATRTLARVLVRGERVFRLFAACPDAAFDALRPDLERILDSFVAE